MHRTSSIFSLASIAIWGLASVMRAGVIDYTEPLGGPDNSGANVSPSYQPIAGVTIAYGPDDTIFEDTPDHTQAPMKDNYFGYARANQGVASFSFSTPVSIPSLWVQTFHATGDQIVLPAYNAASVELTPVGGAVFTPGASWTLDTQLASISNISSFTITNNTIAGSDAANFDDITVVVPEPASLGLLGMGTMGVIVRRRK